MNIQLVLAIVSIIAILFVPANVIHATYEKTQSNAMWSFGENLNAGDRFSYRICEYALHIPELPEPCYDVTLHFLYLLPGTTGNIWIVAVEINHAQKQINTVFHIDAESFEISTDGITIQYANSLERTLEWIKNYAHKMRPQPLTIGKSWGVVATDAGAPLPLLVNQIDFMAIENDGFSVYRVGYALVEESHVYIKDGFPFPLEAVIHKPVSISLAPLTFMVTLISYSNLGVLCDPPNPVQQVPLYFSAKSGLDIDDLLDQQNKQKQTYSQFAKQGSNLLSELQTIAESKTNTRPDPDVMSYEEFVMLVKNMAGQNTSVNITDHSKTTDDNVKNNTSRVSEKTKNTQ